MEKPESVEENQVLQGILSRLQAKHLPVDTRTNAEILNDLEKYGQEESKKQQKRYAEERAEWRKQELVRRANASGIPVEYQSAEIKAFCSEQNEVCERLQGFADNFEKVLSVGANVILHGDIGTGKTHLACAVGNALLNRDFNVQYTTLYRACAFVKEAWNSGEAGDTELKRIRQLIEPDLLIVDEIRIQRDHDMPIITELFDGRYSQRKPTIVISNFEPERLAECLTLPIYDRLTRNPSKLFSLRGASLRGEIELF